MTQRPERIRIIHELGKPQSLASGPETFITFGSGEEILFLGVGPDIQTACKISRHYKKIYYVECPEFSTQMPDHWHTAMPNNWVQLSPEKITHTLLSRKAIAFYTPNSRLFPRFWGPLLAKAQWHHILPDNTPRKTKTVILPGKPNSLLIYELQEAFTQAGYTARIVDPDSLHAQLPTLLTQENPCLFFSVNFQGLDMFGERAHLLREAGVTVAVWCVDVPWHLLSGCKADYWRDIHLFVTDNSFIPHLKQHGATQVRHLPLATSPAIFFSPANSYTVELDNPVIFVGRSAFPNQQKYFSGLHPDKTIATQALSMLTQGLRPHYHWWMEHLDKVKLWPGSNARQVGCGAENTARAWRTQCLEHALPCGLTIFGDHHWKTLLPALTDLREPVDYYTTLPAIYNTAEITLNVTSMLLPSGLTQRHFDVWAAGGVLITDNSPGLHLFPQELTKEITFSSAQDIPALVKKLRKNTSLTKELQSAWQKEITTHHTYLHRVKAILAYLNVG